MNIFPYINNMNLFWGILYGTLGQIISFLQLQGSSKWGWYEKYSIIILISSIPAAWLYIQSVNNFINYFNGTLWPSRFLGFSIGIIIFTIFSYVFFKEPFTLKVFISLILSVLIMCVQIFMK